MTVKQEFELLQEKEMELFYKSIRGEVAKEEHTAAKEALKSFYLEHKEEL